MTYDWPAAATVLGVIAAVGVVAWRYAGKRAMRDIPGYSDFCRNHDRQMNKISEAVKLLSQAQEHDREATRGLREDVGKIWHKLDGLDSWIRKRLTDGDDDR